MLLEQKLKEVRREPGRCWGRAFPVEGETGMRFQSQACLARSRTLRRPVWSEWRERTVHGSPGQ